MTEKYEIYIVLQFEDTLKGTFRRINWDKKVLKGSAGAGE